MMNNLMGFRPLNYAEGDAVMDSETRAAIIDYITSTTGNTSNSVIEMLLNLSDEDLLAARQRVMMQRPAQQMQPDSSRLGTNFGDTGVSNYMAQPMAQDNIGMARGGIMSLRRR